MMDNLDMNRIPEHIAIIMDGNGRWATERGKERLYFSAYCNDCDYYFHY